MKEDATGRGFQRTVINMRPYRATGLPIPPSFDPFYDDPLQPDELLAVRDTHDSNFYLARLLTVNNDSIMVHYLGSRSRTLNAAVFKPCYIHAATDMITMSDTPPAHHAPYTGTLLIADLFVLLVARHLQLLTSDRLNKDSRTKLHSVRDQLATF